MTNAQRNPGVAEGDIFKQTVDEIIKERQAAGEQLPQVDSQTQPTVTQPAGPAWYDYSDAFNTAIDAVSNFDAFGSEKRAEKLEANKDKSLAEIDPVGTAIVMAPAKAVIETNDFFRELAGQHIEEDQKSGLRKSIEAASMEAANQNPVASFAGSATQFITGLIGSGKLLGPLKVAKEGLAVKTALEVTKGALAGAVVMDPHEERLSNLIQSFPALENPVSEYLAASQDDGYMEGRLKNALEGAGLDVTVAGAFALGLKALRFARNGDQEAAKMVVQELGDQKAVDAVVASEAAPLDVPVEAPVEKPRVRVKAGSQPVQDEMLQAAEADIKADLQTAPESQLLADPQPLPNVDKVTTLKPEGISEDQVKAIIRGTEFDLLSLDQAGSRSEAVMQGYKFAPDAQIPWQKLNTPEDVSTLIANTSNVLRTELDALKGGAVLTDVKVERQVRQMARFYNEEPSAVIGMIAKAGEQAAGMVKQMEAGYLLSNRMFLDAWHVTDQIRWGNLTEFGGDTATALAEARRRLQVAFQVYGASQSMRAAAGRSMRRLRGDFAIDPKMVEKLNSLDDEKFLELMDSTGGDPKKIKEMSSPSFLKRVLDEAQFSMRNGLLWNYSTHIVNVTGNVYMQAARPLEKAVGSLLLGGKANAVRRQAVKEFYYSAAAFTDGWKAGFEAFTKGDSKLAPHGSDWLDTNDAPLTAHKPLTMPAFRQMNTIEDIWHNLHLSSLYRNTTGMPTRVLGAQDEFFKTLRYRAVVQARAAVAAQDLGIKGQDLKDFLEDRLKKAFDVDGKAVDREALHEAQTATFNQELLPGTLGAGIRNLRGYFPALGLVLPFVKTPVNVLRYATKYTPGLNMLQAEYRSMIMGKAGVEQQAQAMGQLTLGTLFMGTATMLVANGKITGGGPSDDNLKRQLVEQGWKPYAYHWTDAEGNEYYLPYSRFDPLGMVMGMAADIYTLAAVNPEDQGIADAAAVTTIALAKNFSERTFLLNANQLIDALSDPENKMEKFLGTMGAATMPMSSALRGYANSDPYLRDARSVVDRILKDVPGYSDGLPPRRDAFGDPLLRRIGLTTQYDPDPVEAEHNRIILESGEGLSIPGANHNGVDLRDVKLDNGRTAFDVYQEYAADPFPSSGMNLKKALAKLIESEVYKDMPDGEIGVRGTKLNAFAGIVQDYRAAAYKRLLKDFPEVGKMTRLKQATAASTFLGNRTGDPGQGQNLMKALGY